MARTSRPVARKSLAAERLQLVLELGRHITSILDMDQLLPEACRLVAQAFHYDVVGINLLDPMDDRLLYQAAAYPPRLTLPRSFRVPIGRGLTGWVVRHGRPRLTNDTGREPLYIQGPGRHSLSELDVPLKLGRRTIGVLNVESGRVNAFAEDDVPYLEGIAGQLAQAIENARLAARARQLAAAEERARLARELHDETVQALVGIGRQLDLLALDLDAPDRARERIEVLHEHLDRTLDGVRRLSRNLRPAVLEDLGLVAAIRAHAEELGHVGLVVHVEITGAPARLPPSTELAVFRVAQEALSNVTRHASVSEAWLQLAFSAERLVLTVTDQGIGLDARSDGSEHGGQGLAIMRDRAREIGAELQVVSTGGQGTSVRLEVPLKLTLLEVP